MRAQKRPLVNDCACVTQSAAEAAVHRCGRTVRNQSSAATRTTPASPSDCVGAAHTRLRRPGPTDSIRTGRADTSRSPLRGRTPAVTSACAGSMISPRRSRPHNRRERTFRRTLCRRRQPACCKNAAASAPPAPVRPGARPPATRSESIAPTSAYPDSTADARIRSIGNPHSATAQWSTDMPITAVSTSHGQQRDNEQDSQKLTTAGSVTMM